MVWLATPSILEKNYLVVIFLYIRSGYQGIRITIQHIYLENGKNLQSSICWCCNQFWIILKSGLFCFCHFIIFKLSCEYTVLVLTKNLTKPKEIQPSESEAGNVVWHGFGSKYNLLSPLGAGPLLCGKLNNKSLMLHYLPGIKSMARIVRSWVQQRSSLKWVLVCEGEAILNVRCTKIICLRRSFLAPKFISLQTGTSPG